MVEAAAMVAPQKARGYPAFTCHGISMPPSAVASATAEPDTPPNSVEPSTLTCAWPPRKRPTRSVAKSMRLRPSVPFIISSAAITKNGMAISGKLCVGTNSCWTMPYSEK